MRPIRPDRFEPLHDVHATRQAEARAMAALPPHTLMARAGLSVAQLARALSPHARCIWVACGPGNNGGDGLVAARHLHEWAHALGGATEVVVTHWTGTSAAPSRLPPDAGDALTQAQAAGVRFAPQPPAEFDLAIDALWGIGTMRPVEGEPGQWLTLLRATASTVLCVDLPSGLDADTGMLTPAAGSSHASPAGPRHTLSLLTLKPGLFTGQGRDLAGAVWLDDLGAESGPPTAWLAGHAVTSRCRAHASHKGSHGDVAVIGGQDMGVNGAGMTGAAILAARAALHGGAGRVFVGLLQPDGAPAPLRWDPVCPELMFRQPALLTDPAFLQTASVVCGCGGGSAVAALLPALLGAASRLVLDADALNAIAGDPALQQALGARGARGWLTVLTPHPLEAARLLDTDTAGVMSGRLPAAQALAERFQAVCVLKGSGTVIAGPGRLPLINPSGNAALATAGTGDVLAGWIGSAVATPGLTPDESWYCVASAVYRHGWLADTWPARQAVGGLSAARLAEQATPVG